MTDFDVIIVGGRPAGASLAARLGQRGLSVLVVDKAELPSVPEVPSCPIMYSSAMAVLDEMGLRESEYAHAITPIRTGVVGFEGYFHVVMKMPLAHGRDYLCGVDRARFDHALWQFAAAQPNVTARTGFTVSELLRDDGGRVIGIEGGPKGDKQRYHARLAVVGADGRHSFVARKVGARVTEEQDEHTSTIHYAEWENLAPATPEGDPALQIISTGKGKNVLFFPSCDGRVNIATHVRTDRAERGDADAYYRAQLDALPTVRKRIAGARQVGPLRGVRKIANRYREVGGPGWVLVGDAVHHKDPIDGQGIRDALVGARDLAELLVAAHANRLAWPQLLDRYRAAVLAATHDMYLATMERLVRDLHRDPPSMMIRTLIRWALEDKEYQKRFLLFVARAIRPQDFRTPALMLRVIGRGIARDLRNLTPRVLHRRHAV